ncbi:MAG TPA: aldo/keto reductase [Mycobacteriales bacterium]|nr:aldo/keto reductase [Mycobacteriales bacterium]
MTAIPNLTMNDGRTIPQLGFGVFQIKPDETQAATEAAFAAGYRHIDTAQMYQNEKGVGAAFRASGLARDEVFITTKLNNDAHEPDVARKALAASLQCLDLEFVDLILIHWPLPTLYGGDFVSTWKVLEEFRDQGGALSIGVSNFQVAHLDRLAKESDTVPAVNQIEVHPYFDNTEVRARDAAAGILTEAWSPIAQGDVLGDPVLKEIADRHGRSTAQVTLRWHIQRGDIVFPKTVNPERMRENAAIFDFELTGDDMVAITGLDKGEAGRRGPNPDVFAYIPKS